MERIYSRERYLGRIRKFEKYNKFSGKVLERDQKRRDKKSIDEKEEGEEKSIKSGSRDT